MIDLSAIEIEAGKSFTDFLEEAEENDLKKLNIVAMLIYIYLDTGRKYNNLGKLLENKIGNSDALFFENEEDTDDFLDAVKFISFRRDGEKIIFASDLKSFLDGVEKLKEFIDKHELVENGKAFISIIESFIFGDKEAVICLDSELEPIFRKTDGKIVWSGNIPVIKVYGEKFVPTTLSMCCGSINAYSGSETKTTSDCYYMVLPGLCLTPGYYPSGMGSCCKPIKAYQTFGQKANALLRKKGGKPLINKLNSVGCTPEKAAGAQDATGWKEAYESCFSQVAQDQRYLLQDIIAEISQGAESFTEETYTEYVARAGSGEEGTVDTRPVSDKFYISDNWNQIKTGFVNATIKIKETDKEVVNAKYDILNSNYSVYFYSGSPLSGNAIYDNGGDNRMNTEKLNKILELHGQSYRVE